MIRKLALAVMFACSLIVAYQAIAFGRQLTIDYQNFRKMVIWVAQKQALEERQRAAAKLSEPPAAALPAEAPAK